MAFAVKKKLEVNINQFNEDEDFDLESFQKDFEENWNEETPEEETEETEEVEETVEETEQETVDEEVETVENEQSEETDEEGSEDLPEGDTSKQNQAFAKMRNQLKEEQALAGFVRNLADQQGVSPEELMQAYEQRKLEAQAEQEGVPVDVLKRINQLEEENRQTKQQAFSQKLDQEVNSTIQKYGLKQDQIDSVFSFMVNNGYVNEDQTTNISFEDAYILSNKDNLINQAKEEGRQQYLKEKKNKQQSAAPNTGNSGGNTSSTNKTDFSEDDIMKEFAKMGIDFD